MKMAAVQMVSGTSVEGNLLQAGQLLEQAAAPGRRTGRAARVLLSLGFEDTDKLKVQEPFGTLRQDPLVPL